MVALAASQVVVAQVVLAVGTAMLGAAMGLGAALVEALRLRPPMLCSRMWEKAVLPLVG